jgi:Skp family chaperone for outer membrane proteins
MKTLFALLFLTWAGVASAAPLPPPKLAVVDLDALSLRSEVILELNRKVEAEKAARREAARFGYEKLQEDVRAFRLESASLTPEQRAARQADLEQRIADATEAEKRAAAAVDARAERAMAGLRVQLDEIIGLVASGLNLDVVLEKKAYDALVADRQAAPGAEDITGLVVPFVNDRMKTVELPAEGATP